VIWPALNALERPANFRKPGGSSQWHTDLVHERQPAGITHLHNDTVPTVGGDTLWASGYAAYEKLSPGFRKIIDGKTAIYRSAHGYLDRKNPEAGPKYVEREHPLVRTHPATGWRALWVNRSMTVRIVGLDKAESDLILGYLYDVYERNQDIQVRFKWTPRTSALWDNRYSATQSLLVVRFSDSFLSGSQFIMRAGITKARSPGMEPERPRWQRSHSSTLNRRRGEKRLACWDLMRSKNCRNTQGICSCRVIAIFRLFEVPYSWWHNLVIMSLMCQL
jgi:hypothetical protein